MYQKYRAAGPSIDPVDGRRQWDAFLARWPVSKLSALTLEHHYGVENDDTFYSWMRDHTSKLGEFREGLMSAGVRPRAPNPKNEPSSDLQTDGQYLWYRILGESAQEAFENLKAELLTAVNAVQQGDLSLMDGLKNAPGSLVWKVAFLYQDRSKPLVLPFYSQKQLKRILGPGVSGSTRQLQEQLIAGRGDVDVLEFAATLERQARTAIGHPQKHSPEITMKHMPLNQILYGPPGTGKTYNTINQALAILAPEFLAKNTGDDIETRRRLKAEFDRFAQEDRVRFVTFHQSFSYEDFVEGLRADSDGETAQIEYRVEPGVFKQLCDDARTRGGQVENGIRDNPRIWKISINGTGASATKTYCLEHGEARIGWGKTGDLRESPEQNAYYQSLGSGDKGTLSYFSEQVAVGDILLCIHSADMIGAIGVVTGDYRYEETSPAGVIADYQHVRPVRWLYRDLNLSILPLNDGRQFTLKTVYAMNRFTWADLLGHLEQRSVQPVDPVATPASERKPYVLIIDEINRGNVSRIFGELITLLEESKREGAAEALSLKLPYSKKPFSVPSNVYLIGTMNTADRSLAGLDIALRRRFTFCEMPPRPELLDGVEVGGVDIGKLLQVMNQRIELLLDRDHCLGHAYFIPLREDNSLERLETIFRNHILPLLQEYFFEDWQRIAWVLNDHRKAVCDQFIQQRAGLAEVLFGQEVGQGLMRDGWTLNDEAFERLEAYLGILDPALVTTVQGVKREAVQGDTVLRELTSGSIEVWRAGVLQQPAKPILRELAEQQGLGLHNGNGNLLGTQSLGRRVINRLRNGTE